MATTSSSQSEGSPIPHDRCELHHTEELRFYCCRCREAVCRDCIALDRKHCLPPCDYKPIEDVARICREGLRSLTKRLDDKKAEGQEESGGVEAMLREGKYEAEVSHFYDRLIRELEKKKQKAIQEIREGGESVIRELGAWQKEKRDLLSQIQGLQQSVEGLSDKELLAQRDALTLEAENVELKALPVVGTRAASHKTVSVETVLGKLGGDLPQYATMDPKQSVIQVKKEVEVNTTAHVYITLRDSAGFPCSVVQNVSVKLVPFASGTHATPLTAEVTPLSSSRYSARFTPTLHTRGSRKLTVEVNGERIDDDLVSILVQCPPQHLQDHEMETIDNILYRGCLKITGGRVFCLTRSRQREPHAVYIDGKTVTPAYKLKLPPHGRPDEIAIGNNSLYVSDPHNSKVHRFNLSDGTYIASTGSKGSKVGEFDRPNGLCFAQDNYLYVCDSENHRIQVFDQDLRFCRTFGELGTDRSCFLWPSNIASSSEGGRILLYVSELYNHRVQCVTSTGDHVRFIGGSGTAGERQLSRPNILHVHHSHLYVSDDRGVAVFNLSGEFVTRFATKLCKVGIYPIEGLTVSSDGFVYVYYCPQNRIYLY